MHSLRYLFLPSVRLYFSRKLGGSQHYSHSLCLLSILLPLQRIFLLGLPSWRSGGNTPSNITRWNTILPSRGTSKRKSLISRSFNSSCRSMFLYLLTSTLYHKTYWNRIPEFSCDFTCFHCDYSSHNYTWLSSVLTAYGFRFIKQAPMNGKLLAEVK